MAATGTPRSANQKAASVAAGSGLLAAVFMWGPDFGFDLVELTGVRVEALMAVGSVALAWLGRVARDYRDEATRNGVEAPWWIRPLTNRVSEWIG